MNQMEQKAKRLIEIAEELNQIDQDLMHMIHVKNERLYGLIGSIMRTTIVTLRNISFYLPRDL